MMPSEDMQNFENTPRKGSVINQDKPVCMYSEKGIECAKYTTNSKVVVPNLFESQTPLKI